MASRLWRERHQDGLGDYVQVPLPATLAGGASASFVVRGRGFLARHFPFSCTRAAATALVLVAGATATLALLLLFADGTAVLGRSLPAAPDYETLMARGDAARAACETHASRAKGGGVASASAEVREGMCAAHGAGGATGGGGGKSNLRPPPDAFCPHPAGSGCGGVTWGFLVLGDWGRHGACCARAVAAEMAAAAVALTADRKAERTRRAAVNGSAAGTSTGGPLWVISTGDNFYEDGIVSVEDAAVSTSWVDVYLRPQPPLAAAAWQVVAGNHDYEGNYSAVFDIGRVHPEWHSRRDLYYTRTVTLPGAPATGVNGSDSPAREILFVFLDTTPLVTKPDILRLRYRLSPEALATVAAAVDGGLREWLAATLSASAADWIVVVGHHPIESAGASSVAEAASRGHLRGMLAGPMAAAAAASVGGDGRVARPPGTPPDGVVYFCGHEHDVQQSVVDGVHYVVSGGGSMVEASAQRQPGTRFSVATHAFWGVVVTEEVLSLQVVDYAGRFLYQTVVRPRRGRP